MWGDQGQDTFVERSPGAWTRSTVPPSDVVELDVGAVIDLLRAEETRSQRPRSGPGTSARHHRAVVRGDILAPAWSWVGLVTADGVLVEDGIGGDLLLDEADVRLLDSISGPTPLGDVARVHDDAVDPGIAGRVGELVAAGLLTVAAGPPAPEPEPPPVLVAGPTDPATPHPETGRDRAHRWARAAADRVRVAYRLSSKVRSVRRALGLPPVGEHDDHRGPNGAGPMPATSADERRDHGADGEAVVVRPPRPTSATGADRRIPVYSVWDEEIGPLLSLAMLTSAARSWRDGALERTFDLVPQMTADEFLRALAERPGPAILLSSNYVWSVDDNLDLARRAVAANPELVVVHGGPSTPKYEADAEAFLRDNGDVAHVLVRGEGEIALCEILDVWATSAPHLDPTALADVTGVTFRSGDLIVRTPDRSRIDDLDQLPSPYLSGELDHLDPSAWIMYTPIETNRGCPYGCTFCDWGSATLSRIRKFDMDRVTAEIEWAARRGMDGILIVDANFGIMSRDVEIARRIAEIRSRHGAPNVVGIGPAKNTTKHLTRILDHLLDSGALISAAISLQSTDPDTLAAVNRSNISTDTYLALAADLRRRGHPLQGDIILGMPGHTVDAYKRDLQFFVDHEITPRTWQLKLLPNSPMNDPDYRRAHGIEADGRRVVRSTSAMSEHERDEMLRLRDVEIIGDRYGLFRHVSRFLQWDRGVPMIDFMEAVLDATTAEPRRYPVLTWTLHNFARRPTAACGWRRFYGELRDLIVDRLGVPDDGSLDCVLAVQEMLMPRPGRSFPASITLRHDYVAYYRSATRSLYTTGAAGTPSRPLDQHPPVTFTVDGDPLGLCSEGLHLPGGADGDVLQSDFQLGQSSAYELASPLLRLLPVLGGTGSPIDCRAVAASIVSTIDPSEIPDPDALTPRAVHLMHAAGRSSDTSGAPRVETPR